MLFLEFLADMFLNSFLIEQHQQPPPLLLPPNNLRMAATFSNGSPFVMPSHDSRSNSLFSNSHLFSTHDAKRLACPACNAVVEALIKCFDCDNKICQWCLVKHEQHRVEFKTENGHSRGFPSTRTSPIGIGSSSNGITITTTDITYCDVHKCVVSNFFCLTCGLAVCSDCIEKEHVHHSIDDITNAKLNAKRDNQSMLLDVVRLLSSSEELVESLKKSIDLIQHNADVAVCSVEETHRKIMAILEQRYNELISQIEEVKMERLKALRQESEQQLSLQTRLVRAASELKYVVENGTGLDTLLTRDKYHAELMQMENSIKRKTKVDTTFQYLVPESLMLKIKSMGRVISSPSAAASMVGGKGLGRAVVGKQATFCIAVKDDFQNCKTPKERPFLLEILQPNRSCLNWESNCRDGKYVIMYTPIIEGNHYITISINNCYMKGSPFVVEVIRIRDYSRITAPIMVIGKEGYGNGELCRPWGVCCDWDGNIIVADRSNNRIQVFNSNGTYMMKFGSRGAGPGQFERPAGITVDHKLKRIIVADKDNHRIQVFNRQLHVLFMIGERGSMNGTFHYPWDVAVNADSQIAVSDTRNHRVQLFSSDGKFLNKYGYDTDPLKLKFFDSPRGVCFNSDGYLVVSDFNNHRLVIIHPSFKNANFLGREGHEDLQFVRPQGIAIDREDNIIVADSRNNRIQVIDAAGSKVLRKFGQLGQNIGEMDRPSGICLTPDGKIVVVDFGNNRVQVF